MAAGVGPAGGADNEEAKKLWLAKLDAPTWGKAATALVDIAGSAGAVAAMEDACDQGVTEACDGLSREEEAKRAWLAKMDKPSWGAVTAAVAAVSSEVTSVAGRSVGGAMTAEEIAKHKWLSSVPELTRTRTRTRTRTLSLTLTLTLTLTRTLSLTLTLILTSCPSRARGRRPTS